VVAWIIAAVGTVVLAGVVGWRLTDIIKANAVPIILVGGVLLLGYLAITKPQSVSITRAGYMKQG
jgi:hypothetical protein